MNIAEKLTIIAENERKIYDKGYSDNSGINPEWTDWSYMFNDGARADLIPKLKYSDTRNGTKFVNMFYYCSITEMPELDLNKAKNLFQMCSYCTKLINAPYFNTSICTDFRGVFSSCTALKTIQGIDTQKATDISNMFSQCSSLKIIPNLCLDNVTNMQGCFKGCASITEVDNLNSGKCTNFSGTFNNCFNLKEIKGIDISKATSISDMFSYCSKLEKIVFNGTVNVNNLTMSACNNLTHDSLMSLINALADRSGTTSYTLTLGTTNLAKLTEEEKTIATDKGWVLK